MITGLSVDGMSQKALKSLAIDAWLAATGAGVKKEAVTVGGRDVTRIDYGDGGKLDYVLADNGVVYIVESSDPGARRGGAQGAAVGDGRRHCAAPRPHHPPFRTRPHTRMLAPRCEGPGLPGADGR